MSGLFYFLGVESGTKMEPETRMNSDVNWLVGYLYQDDYSIIFAFDLLNSTSNCPNFVFE